MSGCVICRRHWVVWLGVDNVRLVGNTQLGQWIFRNYRNACVGDLCCRDCLIAEEVKMNYAYSKQAQIDKAEIEKEKALENVKQGIIR